MFRWLVSLSVWVSSYACFAAIAAAENAKPDLEYAYPAPGCPAKLPTQESVERYCSNLKDKACRAASVCSWDEGACGKRAGAYIGTPSDDPKRDVKFDLLHLPFVLEMNPQAVKLAHTAYSAAARGRFDEAVSNFTRAIKLEPARSELLTRRALVHEHKGDKQRALTDYCNSVAVADDWQFEQIALVRIAQITRPDIERVPIPQFGLNRVLRLAAGVHQQAPLKVSTPEGSDYVLKLVNVHTKKEDMWLFIRADSEFATKAPLGTYRIIGAFGPVWYGQPHYFGDKTQFFKLKLKNGNDTTKFYREGNTLYGSHIRLIKQQEGNLLTPSISREEFERNQ